MKMQVRKTIIFFLTLFVAGALTVACAEPIGEQETTIELTHVGFLKASGRNIVDEKGNVVILRGVGLGGWLVPEGYMLKFEGKYDRPRTINELIVDLVGENDAREFWSAYRKNYIAEIDVKTIATLGFNHIRVPFHYNLFVPEDSPSAWEGDGFKLLDDLIDWCGKYGLYVILDMHCAPGGQTGANIDDSVNDQPKLWMDDINKQKTVDVWRRIAEHYQDNPTVIGYDLLNEPIPSQFLQYNEQLIPLYKRIVSAIREVDNKHIIFLEGADWANNFRVFPEPFDSNVVYSFHRYGGKVNKYDVRPYLRLAERHNVPLWCGETGENINQWYYACMQLFEDYNISWCFWPWKKVKSNSGIYSIEKSAGYDAIILYTEGGPKPPRAEAQRALDGFLTNLELENCVENSAVVQSLLKTIPSTVQAENFGFLGEGVSYHDSDKTNEGKAYGRSEGVDIEAYAYSVGWTEAGEWMKYDINNPKDRKFDIEFRVASAVGGGSFRLEIDDEDVTGPITVDMTDGWHDWVIITVKDIEISEGRHKVKLYVIGGEFNIDWFRFK